MMFLGLKLVVTSKPLYTEALLAGLVVFESFFVLAIWLFCRTIYRSYIKYIKNIKLYIKSFTKNAYIIFYPHKLFYIKCDSCGKLHHVMLAGIPVISIGICCIKLIITKVLHQMALLSQIEPIHKATNNAISNIVTKLF